MKISPFIRLCILFVTAFASFFSFAQTANTHNFKIVEGDVRVTPAFCLNRPCPTTTARLAGTFVANINNETLFFTESNLTTSPDVNFQFPKDPNEDSNGVTREFAFTFVGEDIKGKGFIDSRAFDGPLVEYQFAAKLTKSIADIFFTARQDYRKCVYPLCGGYFVKAVNKKLTQCADGSLKEECYVTDIIYGSGPITFPPTSFANTTPVLVIGEIQPKVFPSFGNLGVFKAKAAFRSATQKTATDTFYGVTNNGIVCITTPCFSFDEVLLNGTSRVTKLSDANLEMSGASPDDIAKAYSIMANSGTLYISGKNQRYQGFAGIGLRVVAQQFYLPLRRTSIGPINSFDTDARGSDTK